MLSYALYSLTTEINHNTIIRQLANYVIRIEVKVNKLTEVFKALSDRNRLRIVLALTKYDELCACQLTELIQVTSATASRHMGVLISAKIVESRKDGRWVFYRLCKEKSDLNALIHWVELQLRNDSAAKLDEKDLAKITSIDPEELCREQRGAKCCS